MLRTRALAVTVAALLAGGATAASAGTADTALAGVGSGKVRDRSTGCGLPLEGDSANVPVTLAGAASLDGTPIAYAATLNIDFACGTNVAGSLSTAPAFASVDGLFFGSYATLAGETVIAGTIELRYCESGCTNLGTKAISIVLDETGPGVDADGAYTGVDAAVTIGG